MSIFTIAYPIQAAIPVAQTYIRAAMMVVRPLFGVAALLAIVMMFKPLVVGMLKAIRLAFNPRLSYEERKSRRTLQGVLMLNSMARDLDQSQPNQATELRFLASRGWIS